MLEEPVSSTSVIHKHHNDKRQPTVSKAGPDTEHIACISQFAIGENQALNNRFDQCCLAFPKVEISLEELVVLKSYWSVLYRRKKETKVLWSYTEQILVRKEEECHTICSGHATMKYYHKLKIGTTRD